MNADLAEFLSHLQPVAEESAVWANGQLPLRITAYLAAGLPPLEYVTSVRAIVLRDDFVLTVRDAENTFHILPGGRREEGETIEMTLEREVLEETGWTIREPSLIGILHLRHLAPRPVDYVYPYPDMLQLVYWARAGEFMPWHRKQGEYEVVSGFRPIDHVIALGLPVSQQIFLSAACAAARRER
ncbi:MAG: NUDIX hydrolase [Acidobacteriota bacterium]